MTGEEARKKRTIPNLNTLSVLVATILLAYTLTHFVNLPALAVDLQIGGLYLPLQLNYPTLVSLFVAGLAASGTAWMLRDHPAVDRESQTVEHWILPGLTAMVLMLVIEQIPFSLFWWIGAAVSGLILLLVFTAEYMAVEADHEYTLVAEIVITALSLSFFLILAVSLHAEEIRLFFRVPLISLAAGMVFLRVLHLRMKGTWVLLPAVITSLFIGQLAAGLHYWPMGPIAFGLALLGPLYALIDLGEKHSKEDDLSRWQTYLLPGLFILLSWSTALLL